MCSTLAVSVVGGLLQAGAARQSAQYNAAVARNNAALSVQQAIHAERSGALERDRSVLEFASLQAQADVAFAGGNVQLGVGGTPLVYQLDLQQKAKIDQNILQQNTTNQGNAFLSESNGFLQEAKAQQRQAKAAMTVGVLGTASTLLGAAERTGFSFTDMFKKKSTPPVVGEVGESR